MIARWPRKQTEATPVHDARQLVREMSDSGVHDRAVEADDLALAQASAKNGALGLLAGMLLVPAWHWPGAPLLLEVPDWLRSDFVAWMFSPPRGFTAPGQAEKYAAHTLWRMEEVRRWLNRRPGAAAEAVVLGAFASRYSARPHYVSEGDFCRHAELRGELLTRAHRKPGDHYDALPVARAGRRLRVGFLARCFGSEVDTYSLLPAFEHLDPDRFEVILCSLEAGYSGLQDHCRQLASDYIELPADLAGQLAMLRAAALDIVVFGSNVTDECHGIARLALHRVAPLQVINGSSYITSGLPEIDLYISGTLAAPDGTAARYSERLGLLPGPAQTYNYGATPGEPGIVGSRTDLGLPRDALVFVSIASQLEVTPEMQQTWARLLAELPKAYLLVQAVRLTETAVDPAGRLRSEFARVLAGHGVEPARLVVATESLSPCDDAKALLGLGNIYLDTFPLGRAASAVGALELGLPVVGWEGEWPRSRTGGAMLRSLGLPELVAGNEADYRTIAIRLATDHVHREQAGARIRAQMDRTPIFLDSLAASEVFGDLIEAAYDEMVEVGAEVFRANPEPLRATRLAPVEPEMTTASAAEQARNVLRRTPADPAARRAYGRALLDAGRPGRAVTYLLAALQGAEENAALWLEIAAAFRADGQGNQAIEALEAGLRIDDTRLEGWQMLAELAREAGVIDLAEEATEVVQKLGSSGQKN